MARVDVHYHGKVKPADPILQQIKDLPGDFFGFWGYLADEAFMTIKVIAIMVSPLLLLMAVAANSSEIQSHEPTQIEHIQ